MLVISYPLLIYSSLSTVAAIIVAPEEVVGETSKSVGNIKYPSTRETRSLEDSDSGLTKRSAAVEILGNDHSKIIDGIARNTENSGARNFGRLEVIEDVSDLLPPGFSILDPNTKLKNLESKSESPRKETSENLEKNENLVLKHFGKVTTTTVDPIAEILADVIILDPTKYLPKGYEFNQEETIEVVHEVEIEGVNVNGLLVTKDRKNERRFKPGKLNGKKFATVAKELKEAEEYYANAGDEESNLANSEETDVLKSVSDDERGGRKISDEILEFSAESIFSSILKGNEIKIEETEIKTKGEVKSNSASSKKQQYGWREPKGEKANEFAMTTSSVSPVTKSPATTTTSTPKPRTPGVCGEFCNLAGTVFIKSGLQWSEELQYSFTEQFKEVSTQIVKEISRIFDHVYFGKSFEFASIEAFSRRDELVLVDIYVQFSNIVFRVTTEDVKESFVERLSSVNNKTMMGEFEVDTTWTYFMVVDTTIPIASMSSDDGEGFYLPKWSLLAAVMGVLSTFIIAFLGVIFGVNRYRNNQVLKSQVLNPQTLQRFKSLNHFDTVSVDDATAYALDKRDMWTLQKLNQKKEGSKVSLATKRSSDSGRGSTSAQGSFSYIASKSKKSFGKGGKNLYEKFPGIQRNSRGGNHNDSNAELLEGFNNAGFSSSEEVLENNATDTSYENENDEFEVKVKESNVSYRSRKTILNTLGEPGIAFEDSDTSADAVSDGPSEKF